jgi:hypothetical protein
MATATTGAAYAARLDRLGAVLERDQEALIAERARLAELFRPQIAVRRRLRERDFAVREANAAKAQSSKWHARHDKAYWIRRIAIEDRVIAEKNLSRPVPGQWEQFHRRKERIEETVHQDPEWQALHRRFNRCLGFVREASRRRTHEYLHAGVNWDDRRSVRHAKAKAYRETGVSALAKFDLLWFDFAWRRDGSTVTISVAMNDADNRARVRIEDKQLRDEFTAAFIADEHLRAEVRAEYEQRRAAKLRGG